MSFVIDLDAERREVQYPNGIPVKLNGEQFLFPAEIPADALDPILSDDLNLFGVFSDVLEATEGDIEVIPFVLAVFRHHSRVPKAFLAAVRETYAVLLGDQYEAFSNARPSIGDYVRLTTALTKVYGVDLGKLFRSATSENGSQTSSPTSPASTESTPAASGSGPDSQASSASDG